MWIASLLSGTCGAAQDTAATWVIEYADSIPVFDISDVDSGVAVFLLTLPAGALADLVDRKKLLCVINLWLAAAAAGLAIPGSLHRQSLHRSSYPVKGGAHAMNQKERRDLTDSSQREHGIGFEGPGEQRNGKSLFQLALEVEDLLDKQKLKRDLGVIRIRRYIE
jgi:Transmembrane secretion effector